MYYGGTLKTYKLEFRAPKTRAFTWAFRFEGSRRRSTVFLNGRRIGISIDPYTPFEVPARGLRPGAVNTLTVTVDSRKDPRAPEGWWNWGGIVRPVSLVPRGRVYVRDPAFLSKVACKGQARRCKASVLVDGLLSKLPRERVRRTSSGQARRAPPADAQREAARAGRARHPQAVQAERAARGRSPPAQGRDARAGAQAVGPGAASALRRPRRAHLPRQASSRCSGGRSGSAR